LQEFRAQFVYDIKVHVEKLKELEESSFQQNRQVQQAVALLARNIERSHSRVPKGSTKEASATS
jgi:hypothetical protein